LGTDPARYVLVTPPGEQGVQHILALVMQHSWVITEIITNNKNVEQFLVSLFSLHRDGQLVLVLYDLVDGVMVKLVEEALLTVRDIHAHANVLLDRIPYRVDIHRRAEYEDPFKASPIMP
jgi:hypothetical protein